MVAQPSIHFSQWGIGFPEAPCQSQELRTTKDFILFFGRGCGCNLLPPSPGGPLPSGILGLFVAKSMVVVVVVVVAGEMGSEVVVVVVVVVVQVWW